jgi:hypothetical protein
LRPLVLTPSLRLAKAIAAVLLSCALGLSHPGCARAMSFRMAPTKNPAECFGGGCGFAIVADGEITDATPEEFLGFLRANFAARRGGVLVFIDSPGGKIVAGMELGKIFRRIGVTAVVARVAQSEEGGASGIAGGVCFSSCVYALMGAKKRIAPHQSKIGIHRMFAYQGHAQKFDDGAMAAVLRRYSATMGVSAQVVLAAEQERPDAVRILTPAEIARWRLASPQS